MDKQNVYAHDGILLSFKEKENAFLKRKEILTHGTTRMNLEDIMQSEISQTWKDKYCLMPLLWGSYSSQNYRDRNWSSGCHGL